VTSDEVIIIHAGRRVRIAYRRCRFSGRWFGECASPVFACEGETMRGMLAMAEEILRDMGGEGGGR